MAWEKNGTPDTLGSDGDTIEITDLTSKKFNQFLCHALATAGVLLEYVFNADTTGVYAARQSINGAADGTSTSDNGLRPDGFAQGADFLSIGYCCNISGEEKLVIEFLMHQNATGAANAPARCELVGKYVPSPDADITEVRIANDQAGDYLTSSNLSALGTD